MRIRNARSAYRPVIFAASIALGGHCLGAESPTMQGGEPAAHFDVLEYRVVGNTRLPARDVERAVYAHLGPNKSIADVQAARAALEAQYHAQGFGTIFVDVPEQDVDNGIVRLRVTEGTLHSVRISGAQYFSERQIKNALPEAKPGTTPNLAKLQSQLATVNSQTADLQVVPVLKAGPVPGTMDLALTVQDKLPFHGSLELNNQRTIDTAPLRLIGSAQYEHFLGRPDTLSLQYQVAPDNSDQIRVFATGYTLSLNDSGSHLALFFVDSNSNVATVGGVTVLGQGKIYSMRLVEPTIATPSTSQSLSLGADWKDVSQTVGVTTGSPLNTPIQYLNLSVGYSASWQGGSQQWLLAPAVNFGVRGINDQTQFADKRYKAQANYMYLRLEASDTIRLPHDWRIALDLGGQVSSDPLVSNEQFSIGGVSTVQGYLESEQFGDNGARASLTFATPKRTWGTGDRSSANLFLFGDIGWVGLIDPLPGETSGVTLRSWGLGMQSELLKFLDCVFTWAEPLVTTSYTHGHEPRYLFVVRGIW